MVLCVGREQQYGRIRAGHAISWPSQRAERTPGPWLQCLPGTMMALFCSAQLLLNLALSFVRASCDACGVSASKALRRTRGRRNIAAVANCYGDQPDTSPLEPGQGNRRRHGV